MHCNHRWQCYCDTTLPKRPFARAHLDGAAGIRKGENRVGDIRREDRERLEYVGAMLGELRRMTDAERYPMLTFLIEMASLEANEITGKENRSGRGGSDRDAVA